MSRKANKKLALSLAVVMSVSALGLPVIESASKGLIGYATSDIQTESSENSGDSGDQTTPAPTPPPAPEPSRPPSLPSCSLSDTTYTTEEIDIRIDRPNELMLEYALIAVDGRLSNSSWKSLDSNTVSISKKGSYDFYYRVTNIDTNLTTTSSAYTVYFDTTAPKAPKINIEKSVEDQCVYVELDIQEDNGSPLEGTYYRIDNGSWKDYRSKIELDDEDKFEIEAYSIDKCGNESSVTKKEIEVSYEDLIVLPKVKRMDDSPSADSIRYKLDDYSRVYDYEYKFTSKGSKSGTTDWERCKPSTYMEISEPGEWDLHIKVDYEKKSINGKVATCIIDRTRPEVYEVTKDSSGSKSNYITLTVDAKDEVSGRELEYSFDNGDHWQSSKSKTFKASTILKIGDIQVRDECENVAYAPYAYQVDVNEHSATYKQIQAYHTKNKMMVSYVAQSKGYVTGMGNGLFEPDSKIKRSELASMLDRVIDFGGNSTAVIRYNDVETSNWAHKSIINVQRYDLIKTEDAFFYPNKEVTRGELAYALCQFIDLDGISPGKHSLKDISKSEFEQEIIRVNTAGLMSGYGEGKFGPNDILTRAQVVAVINRIINISDGAASNGKQFKDVPNSHWAYNDILKASH